MQQHSTLPPGTTASVYSQPGFLATHGHVVRLDPTSRTPRAARLHVAVAEGELGPDDRWIGIAGAALQRGEPVGIWFADARVAERFARSAAARPRPRGAVR